MGAWKSMYGCMEKYVWVHGKVCMGAWKSVYGMHGKACMGAWILCTLHFSIHAWKLHGEYGPMHPYFCQLADVVASQILSVLSTEPDTILFPSGEKATEET